MGRWGKGELRFVGEVKISATVGAGFWFGEIGHISMNPEVHIAGIIMDAIWPATS